MLIGTLTIKSLFLCPYSFHCNNKAAFDTSSAIITSVCYYSATKPSLFTLLFHDKEWGRKAVICSTNHSWHLSWWKSRVWNPLLPFNHKSSQEPELQSKEWSHICRFSQTEGQALLWDLHNHTTAILDRPPFRPGITNNMFTPTGKEQSCHSWLSLGMQVTEKMSNSTTCVKGSGESYPLEPAPEKPLLLLSRELIQVPWNKQGHRTILQCHYFQNYHPAQLTANLLHSLV